MSSRHRTCHHLLPNVHPNMPRPELLMSLAPFMGTLIDAAAEFDSLDEQTWSAVSFAQWLDVEVRASAARTRGAA